MSRIFDIISKLHVTPAQLLRTFLLSIMIIWCQLISVWKFYHSTVVSSIDSLITEQQSRLYFTLNPQSLQNSSWVFISLVKIPVESLFKNTKFSNSCNWTTFLSHMLIGNFCLHHWLTKFRLVVEPFKCYKLSKCIDKKLHTNC